MDSKSTETLVDKKSTRERVKGLVELIPMIGPFLKYLIEHWGIKETIFAVAGFIFGWGIVYFGFAPGFLISKYKEKPPLSMEGSKPSKENQNVSTIVFVIDERGPVSNALVTLTAYLRGEPKFKNGLTTDDWGTVRFELADSLKESSVDVEVDDKKKITQQKLAPLFEVRMERSE